MSIEHSRKSKSRKVPRHEPVSKAGCIISFRLDGKDLVEKLNDALVATPIVGLNSDNKLCRKIVVDYLEGRLVYKIRSDRAIDPILLRRAGVGQA